MQRRTCLINHFFFFSFSCVIIASKGIDEKENLLNWDRLKLKVNLHIHITFSDEKYTISEVIGIYQRNGYDAIEVYNHKYTLDETGNPLPFRFLFDYKFIKKQSFSYGYRDQWPSWEIRCAIESLLQ